MEQRKRLPDVSDANGTEDNLYSEDLQEFDTPPLYPDLDSSQGYPDVVVDDSLRPSRGGRFTGETLSVKDVIVDSAANMLQREMRRIPMLSDEETRLLAQRREAGDASAGQAIAAANERLVVSLAKDYTGHGLPLEDLIGEGNLGLMRAIEKYDWRKDNTFGTYATGWIKNFILRAIATTSRTVAIPKYVHEDLLRYNKRATQILAEENRVASPEELAEELDLTPETIQFAIRANSTTSLNLPVDAGDGEEEFGDILPDPASSGENDPIMDYLNGEDMVLAIRDALGRLNPRQRLVLERRFGIYDGREWLLEEVGKELKVTRERVRQIQERAIRILRHPNIVKMLQDFE